MDSEATTSGARASTIKVAGLDLAYRAVMMIDRTPTGAQIAVAAGFAPISQAIILQVLEDGGFEDVRQDETVPVKGGEKFIVVESDRSFRITIDGHRVDWPADRITGEIVRKLGRVPDSKEVYYEQQDTADRLLGSGDSVDLSEGGVEAFYSRAATWVLNVQGVRLELSVPTITARDALVMAKFAPEEWRIYLKYADRAKEQIELATMIDLRVSGIEKIWLIPREVDNGEAARALRRAFALLEADEDFLDERFASWETFEEAGRRWLTIQGFHVPAGYNGQRRVTLAMEVPPNYPAAQIDMFFVAPALSLSSGVAIPNTEHRESILGEPFQRWSRHRNAKAPWLPESDNVITHLALVESALRKEVEQ